MTDKTNKVTIYCDGGCGAEVTMRRKSRIHHADFYVCNSRANGDRCKQIVLAKKPADMIAVLEFNAAAHFMGITFKIPDEEERASLARANRLKRYGMGLADRAELQVHKGGKAC
ncbi:MAG TPA: hypothetical protein VE224_20120 [Pseudolabrys sp.]|jgi:hypothetical protein|nr:hypothetical protein [Pseudolabrys sp.]